VEDAQALRAQRHTWREIYWHVWGMLHVLLCQRCKLHFPIAHFDHCGYHPDEASFATGANEGVFRCCHRKALRFDTTQTPNSHLGCQARSHHVDSRLEDQALIFPPDYAPPYEGGGGRSDQVENLLLVLERHRGLVVVPFPVAPPLHSANSLLSSPPSPSTLNPTSPRQEPSKSGGAGRGSENRILTSRSLRECLLAGMDPAAGVGDEDEDEEDEDYMAHSLQDEEDRRRSQLSSSCSGSDDERNAGPSPIERSKKPHSRRARRQMLRSHLAWSSKVSLSETLQNMPPRLQRALRQDALRQDEESRLEALMYSLDSVRKDQPVVEEAKTKAKLAPSSASSSIPRSRPGSAKSLPTTRVARDALKSRTSSRWSQLSKRL